jgi:hypothetical protein
MKAELTFHPKTFITEINFSFSEMSLETFHPKIPLGTLNPTAACDPSLSLSLSLFSSRPSRENAIQNRRELVGIRSPA